MLEKKTMVKELADDLGIKLNGWDEMPDFGMCPTLVQVAPGKNVHVKDRFYTMGKQGDGDWYPIKEVSKQYKLVQHWQAIGAMIEGIQKFLPTFGIPKINLQFSENGARMFNDVRWNQSKMEVNKDSVIPILRQENSVDLSRRFLTQFRAERLVCTNGMTVPDSRFPNKESVRKLHLKGTLNLDEQLKITMDNMESMNKVILGWDNWTTRDISNVDFVQALEYIGITETQAEELVTTSLRGFKGTLSDKMGNGKRANLWEAYNSVTQWITDNTKNPATESERSRKASEVFEQLALSM